MQVYGIAHLLRALENHGDTEGTEAQLNAAESFLRLAYDMLPACWKTTFMRCDEVQEYMAENYKKAEDDNDESDDGLETE